MVNNDSLEFKKIFCCKNVLILSIYLFILNFFLNNFLNYFINMVYLQDKLYALIFLQLIITWPIHGLLTLHFRYPLGKIKFGHNFNKSIGTLLFILIYPGTISLILLRLEILNLLTDFVIFIFLVFVLILGRLLDQVLENYLVKDFSLIKSMNLSIKTNFKLIILKVPTMVILLIFYLQTAHIITFISYVAFQNLFISLCAIYSSFMMLDVCVLPILFAYQILAIYTVFFMFFQNAIFKNLDPSNRGHLVYVKNDEVKLV